MNWKLLNVSCDEMWHGMHHCTALYVLQNVVVVVFVVVFVALRPMSTAMVIAGQSVHLTTLFPGQA